MITQVSQLSQGTSWFVAFAVTQATFSKFEWQEKTFLSFQRELEEVGDLCTVWARTQAWDCYLLQVSTTKNTPVLAVSQTLKGSRGQLVGCLSEWTDERTTQVLRPSCRFPTDSSDALAVLSIRWLTGLHTLVTVNCDVIGQ